MDIISNFCRPGNRCNRWRYCEACAAIRQSRIADAAEDLERKVGPLWLTVAKPAANTEKALRALRSTILRASMGSPGIWTVETGEKFQGLHLNFIAPDALRAPFKAGTTWSQALRLSAREAAAYISKRSGMPSPDQYSGRLFGTFGAIQDILISENMPATIQAASIESLLKPPGGRLTISERRAIEQTSAMKPQRSMEEYRQIARKHLPHIFATLEGIRLSQPDDAE